MGFVLNAKKVHNNWEFLEMPSLNAAQHLNKLTVFRPIREINLLQLAS